MFYKYFRTYSIATFIRLLSIYYICIILQNTIICSTPQIKDKIKTENSNSHSNHSIEREFMQRRAKIFSNKGIYNVSKPP